MDIQDAADDLIILTAEWVQLQQTCLLVWCNYLRHCCWFGETVKDWPAGPVQL